MNRPPVIFLTIAFILFILAGCKKKGSVIADEAAPTIAGFAPLRDSTDAHITIKGANFSSTLSNNIVKFNNISATVLTASTTQLVVIVPSGLPPTSTVSVTTFGQTATASSSFSLIHPLLLSGTWYQFGYSDSTFRLNGDFFSYTQFTKDTTAPFFKQRNYWTFYSNATYTTPITVYPAPSNINLTYVDFITSLSFAETASDFTTGERSQLPFDTAYIRKFTRSELILHFEGNKGGVDTNDVWTTFRHHTIQTLIKY